MSVELFLARRYLLDRKDGAWGWLISLMATGSVALGVAILITTLAIMTGFREDIRQKMLGVHPHVFVYPFSGKMNPEAKDVQKILSNKKEVQAWAPFVKGQILIGRGRQSTGGSLTGIDPVKEPLVSNIEGQLVEGKWSDLLEINEKEKPNIVLGQELARVIGARVGDTIWIITPNSIGIGAMSVPRAELFIVSGLLKTGLHDYDTILTYTNMKAAQNLFDQQGLVSGFGVRLKNIELAERFSEELQNDFDGAYWVRSWLSQNRNLFSALKLERTVMFLIFTMITVVASFMIISNLLLTISQKTKEIGILRAMGATEGTIKKIFLYQGLIMGFLGNLAGVILGVSLSFVVGKTNLINLPSDVYYIDKLPVRIVPLDIVLVSVVAGFIVLIAALYPARKAAKLDPLDAIRYG